MVNLENAFILFFGGVMGPSQGLDLIVDAAKAVAKQSDIIILLFGDGSEKGLLMKRAQQEKLENIIFHPFVSKEEYGRIVREIDVGLLCLTPKNKTPVVPGKLLSYMAAGIPVLAFLNRESDGHQIIREAHCGYSAVSDDANTAALMIMRMYEERNRLGELGYSGYQYAFQHFSRRICIDKLEALLHDEEDACRVRLPLLQRTQGVFRKRLDLRKTSARW
jgi:glycosyltransferase involved in cell wall biosynthesis